MDKKGMYTQTEYAKLKNVSRPYISKLVKNKKLKTVLDMDKQRFYVLDCQENDSMFKNK